MRYAVDAVIEVPDAWAVDELEVDREVVRQAREAGVALTGPGGLLKAMTMMVIKTALEKDTAEPLGYDRHAIEGRGSAISGTEPGPRRRSTVLAGRSISRSRGIEPRVGVV